MPFEIIPSVEISHRVDFSLLANARGYRDAVEVGTDLGVFARDFLSRFKGHWLYLIDPYEPVADFPHNRTLDAMVAAQALAPYHGRFRFVRHRSPEAIPWVLSQITPEFVYIDGSHEEGDVMADLVAWWDVLPINGMLAGHDFDFDHYGVMAAVERFARDRGLVVRLTAEKQTPPSWYIYKHEPETLLRRLFTEDEIENPHYREPGR